MNRFVSVTSVHHTTIKAMEGILLLLLLSEFLIYSGARPKALPPCTPRESEAKASFMEFRDIIQEVLKCLTI